MLVSRRFPQLFSETEVIFSRGHSLLEADHEATVEVTTGYDALFGSDLNQPMPWLDMVTSTIKVTDPMTVVSSYGPLWLRSRLDSFSDDELVILFDEIRRIVTRRDQAREAAWASRVSAKSFSDTPRPEISDAGR